MDTVTAEFIQQLLCHLGQGRCQSESRESTQAIMCLCALMKGRSRTVLGMQLLITFMLIARATSRQVCTYITYHYRLKLCTTVHIGHYCTQQCWYMEHLFMVGSGQE
jgi:hypothetical protein